MTLERTKLAPPGIVASVIETNKAGSASGRASSARAYALLREHRAASCHWRAGKSPRRFDNPTASARSRAFSFESDRTLGSPRRGGSSLAVAASSSSGDKASKKSSYGCRRDTSPLFPRRAFLLRGGCPMPMASPSIQDAPHPVVSRQLRLSRRRI